MILCIGSRKEMVTIIISMSTFQIVWTGTTICSYMEIIKKNLAALMHMSIYKNVIKKGKILLSLTSLMQMEPWSIMVY